MNQNPLTTHRVRYIPDPTRCECGGRMRKAHTNTSSRNALMIVGLLLCLSVYGGVIGLPMMIIGFLMGRKIWQCELCKRQSYRA